MLVDAPLDGVAVIVKIKVPGGVRPCGPWRKLAQPASNIASKASPASAVPSRRCRFAAPIPNSATANMPSAHSICGPLPPLGGGASRGASQAQNVFTTIAVCTGVDPLAVTVPGEIEQVIVGC